MGSTMRVERSTIDDQPPAIIINVHGGFTVPK